MNKLSKNILKFFFIAVLTTCTTILYWFLYGKPLVGIDDSDIYFVYARNLIDGHGLVYNIGGEHVEGFTSMLWLLIISVTYAFFTNYELVLMALTTLMIAFGIFKLAQLNDVLNNFKSIISPSTVFILGALLFISGYIDWTIITLMETGLWSFIIILFTTVIARAILKQSLTDGKYRFYYAIFCALLIITRPESLLWAPVFIIIIFVLCLINNKSFKISLLTVLPGIASMMVMLVLLTIFRLKYFGYPLPNTYYAKVSSDTLYNIYQGVRYFLRACIKLPFLFIVSVGIVYSTITLLKTFYKSYITDRQIVINTNQQVQVLLTAVSLISILIPVLTGGDHFHLARFYQPYFPIYLATLLNFKFWDQNIKAQIKISESHSTYIWFSMAIIFLYLTPKVPLHDYIDIKSPIDHEFRLAELGQENGEKLNKLFEGISKPSIGVSAAGGFAYSYEGNTVDLMGLNNTLMAHAVEDKKGVKNHAAFDINTFFKLNPKIFHGYKKVSFFISHDSVPPLLEDSGHKSYTFVNNMYKGLMNNPRFIDEYFPVFISRNGLTYTTYMRKEYIIELKKLGFNIKIRPTIRRESLTL